MALITGKEKHGREMNKGVSNISALAGGIIILSGLLASGCNRQKDVISEKEMVELITDLKLAEAYSNNQLGGPMHAEARQELANSILAAHNVTQEQLDSTLGWYGRNLDKYSELFEKVDKRIVDKRKRLMKDTEKGDTHEEGDNLWPYQKNGVISSLGNSDGWILSISEPDLRVGDRLEWSIHLKDVTMPMIGVLGVEYDDGTSEAVTSHFTNRQHVDISLQTDTAKTVTRVYGTMRRKNKEIQPLYADSISLHKIPFDSIEYNKFRSQKKYGYPVRITQEDRIQKAKADSIRQDSIRQAASMRRDSIANAQKRAAELQSNPPADKSGVKPVKEELAAPAEDRPIKPVKPGRTIRKSNT